MTGQGHAHHEEAFVGEAATRGKGGKDPLLPDGQGPEVLWGDASGWGLLYPILMAEAITSLFL